MTKKKKLCLILTPIIALVCIAATLFSLFWFVPYRRHWTFQKEPLEVSTLLAYPDAIVCHIDGKNKWLSEEEIEGVWARLDDLLTGRTDGFYKMPMNEYILKTEQIKERPMCIELRYRQRRLYTGNVLSKEPFEYDAMLLVEIGGNLVPVPYLGCTYRDTIGALILDRRKSLDDLENYVKG